MRIFISYRRGDAGGHAGRLADALRSRLGRKGVFQDVTAIAPGEDFALAIDGALDQCDAVLAVIGPNWQTAAAPDGAPRLLERGDYVRLELGRALERAVPVVPVLVGGATLPRAADLPDELSGLVQRQAVVLHDETWHEDVDGLLRGLRGELEPGVRQRRQRLIAGAAALVLVAGAATWWFLTAAEEPSSAGDVSAPLACAPPRSGGWKAIELGPDPRRSMPTEGGTLTFTVREASFRAGADGRWSVVLATSMENETDHAIYHGEWHYDSLIVGQHEFPRGCYAEDPAVVSAATVGDALVGFDVRCEPEGYLELVVDERRLPVTDPALGPGPC